MIVQLAYEQLIYVEVDTESGEVIRVVEDSDGPTPSRDVESTAWYRETPESGGFMLKSPAANEVKKAIEIAETADWPTQEWGY